MCVEGLAVENARVLLGNTYCSLLDYLAQYINSHVPLRQLHSFPQSFIIGGLLLRLHLDPKEQLLQGILIYQNAGPGALQTSVPMVALDVSSGLPFAHVDLGRTQGCEMKTSQASHWAHTLPTCRHDFPTV